MTGTDSHEPSWAEEHLFQARLAEYVSARDEMISAISNQHLALTFGTASIVGVFVAGFLTWKQPGEPAIFFAVAPLSAWVLAMWLAEVVRMLRAVEFCREQAVLINESTGVDDPDNPPMRWEAWRDPSRTITWTYISVVVVLLGAYVGGVVLGLITAGWSASPAFLVAAVFALALIVILKFVAKTFVRWSSPNSRVGMPPGVEKWVGWLVRPGSKESGG